MTVLITSAKRKKAKPRPGSLRMWVAAFVLSALVAGAFAPRAEAFHFPWDQGHDTFSPDDPGGGGDPGDDGPNKDGSPVELATGNLRFDTVDMLIPDRGMPLGFGRSYNTLDERSGPLGVGWTCTYDERVIETTDGQEQVAILRGANGKRERFVRQASGAYTSPTYSFKTLIKQADGSFDLRLRRGGIRRYDPSGRLMELVGRNANTLRLQYDSGGFLSRITGPSGRTLTMIKAPNGRLDSIRDDSGRSCRFEYDGQGRLERAISPVGGAISYEYDTSSRLAVIRNEQGAIVNQVNYDGQGRVASLSEFDETFTYTYANGRTTKRDSQGNNWVYDYNATGNITRVTNPNGRSQAITYNAQLQIESVSDELGRVVRHTFDSRGNVASIIGPNGDVATLTYDSVHNRIETATTPAAAVTRYSYDGNGNLASVTDAEGNVGRMSYTGDGQLAGFTDPLGNAIRYEYDANGFVSRFVDANGNVTQFTYDGRGNTTSTTDAVGNAQTFEYDDLDRLVRAVDATGHAVTYSYDTAGNLLRLTDKNGNATVYTYDNQDRLVAKADPMGNVLAYDYDARGNLARLDSSGRVTTFTYDNLDRVVRKTTADNDVRFAYNDAGNLVAVDDNDSSIRFSYDHRARLVQAETLDVGVQPATRIVYDYDGNGRRVAMTDPDGQTTRYTYDALSRLRTIQVGTRLPVDLTYDPLLRLTQLTMPNGSSTAYAYDAYGQLNQLTQVVSGGSLPKLTYDYDALGRQTSLQMGADPPTTYSYDPVSRLMGANVLADPTRNESYTYDASGNRLSSHQSASYDYDTLNRLEADNQFRYTYDAHGNLKTKTEGVSGQVTRYTYDGEDQLVQIDFADGSVATYRYDGLGRRIEKNVDGVITQYVYDGPDVLVEYAPNGVVLAKYAHGPAVDQPIMMERGGSDFYYLSDGLGSVTALTDAAGDVVASYSYDSFGNITEATGGVENPYTYTGREYDTESGLYYYRSRYYDPQAGRFIQEDPIHFLGGYNVYRYAANSPLNLYDPFGLDSPHNNWLDWLQTGLDVVGLVPGFGEAADLLNAGIYAGRGDWLNAGLSAGAAVPFAGWGATAGKFGNKATRWGNRAPSGFCFAEGTTVATEDGFEEIQTLEVGDRVLTSASDAQTSTTTVDPTWKLVKLALFEPASVSGIVHLEVLRSADWLAFTDCVRGERIWFELPEQDMAGWARVESVEPAPPVESSSGRVVLSKVRHLARGTVEMVVGSDKPPVTTTMGHRFFSVTRGAWVAAGGLRPGEILQTRAGTVALLAVHTRDTVQAVYNIEVDTDHCYFVSDDEILSHNSVPCSAGSRPPNLSPPGAGRRGAFREAKREAGVPVSQQPSRVLPNVNRQGNPQPGRIYEYDVPAPGGGRRTVQIRDDAGGHNYGPGNAQNRGPHFNTPDGGHFDY